MCLCVTRFFFLPITITVYSKQQTKKKKGISIYIDEQMKKMNWKWKTAISLFIIGFFIFNSVFYAAYVYYDNAINSFTFQIGDVAWWATLADDPNR